jgi:hypothetical protein
MLMTECIKTSSDLETIGLFGCGTFAVSCILPSLSAKAHGCDVGPACVCRKTGRWANDGMILSACGGGEQRQDQSEK